MRRRTRSTGQRAKRTSAYCYYWGQNPTYYYLDQVFTPDMADIADEPGYATTKLPDGRVVQLYKGVRHVKWQAEGNFDPLLRQDCSGLQMTCYYSPMRTWASKFNYLPPHGADPGFVHSNWVLSGVPDVASGHYDRWLKAKPSLTTRLNLSVFLAELRDISRMFEILPGRHFSSKNPYDLLTYANNQHLSYNFGWKPFLRDIYSLVKGVTEFESRLRQFLQEEGVLLTKHISGGEQTFSPYERLVSSYDTTWARIRTGHYSYVQRSTFQFTYELPKLSENEIRWRALLDTLGLTMNPSDFWAIMPWSFVVDWFVSVKSVLEKSNEDWLQPWVYFAQACTSIRVDYSIQDVVENTYPGCTAVAGTACSTKGTYYERVAGLPNFSLRQTDLDADKIRLLTSLLGSLILRA